MTDVDVAIIGSGISGLSTAWYLQQQRPNLSIAVFEQQGRAGGRIDSTKVGSHEVELGADATIARDGTTLELLGDLGLEDELEYPAVDSALIYTDNELRKLPTKTAFGLPTSASELKQTKLISRNGIRQFSKSFKRSFDPTDADMSLGMFARERLGDEVVENLVDPLLGSIHAAPIDSLSLHATAPHLAEIARSGKSLNEALPQTKKRENLFVSLQGGMPRLISRLHERINENNAIKLSHTVARIEEEKGTYVVVTTDRKRFTARFVVLAVPSYVASELVRGINDDASALLEEIPHASVAMCVLSYKRQDVHGLPKASGFLFGRDSLLLMTACSFASQKWARYNDTDEVVFRVSAGRTDDIRPFAMGDKELVQHLHTDLASILDIRSVPGAATLRRWPRSFPQYGLGHLQTVDAIESLLNTQTPRILLAGASYRGVGVPACIRQGKRAADHVMDSLEQRSA